LKSNTSIVVIDSNFILLPFQFKIDYFNEIRLNIEGELKFIIFQQILNELDFKRKKLQKRTNFIRFLKSGLLYLERNKEKYHIEILEDLKKNNDTTDEFLLKMLKNMKVENQNIYLATNDSELRKKAKNLGISTIFLRQKKYISIERA
jgi:rRNA-processing protein FCF1